MSNMYARDPAWSSGLEKPMAYRNRSSSQDDTADSMKLPVVRKKMEDLFVYYAQLGDRLNTTHLKSHKFHKILVDAGLEEAIDEQTYKSGVPKLARERVDLVFKRCTRSTLTFTQFLTSLVFVAEEYQKHITTFYESSKMNLRRRGQLTGRSVKGILIEEVLRNHLLPLHETVQNQMNKEADFHFGWNGDQLAKELMTLKFNSFIGNILKDVGTILNQIYKQFFPHELVRVSRNLDKDTEKSLYNFLREFEIFPGIVSVTKSQILHIFLMTKS